MSQTSALASKSQLTGTKGEAPANFNRREKDTPKEEVEMNSTAKLLSSSLSRGSISLMNTASTDSTWIFGYGSLMWKKGGLQYQEDMVGYVNGMTRRFWQGSPDHRGKPEAPGRVLTLAKQANATTWGTAIRVHKDLIPNVDQRETGYIRKKTLFYPSHASEPFEVETYIAREDNPHYLGPASLTDLAQDIAYSKGQSGCNAEYLFALCDYLNNHNIMSLDSHLCTLEGQVKALLHLGDCSESSHSSKAHPVQCNCVYHRAFSKRSSHSEEPKQLQAGLSL